MPQAKKIPKIFIGSSAESKSFAEAVQSGLSRIAIAKLWTNNAFKLSSSNIANLKREMDCSDFGVFILSNDDMAIIRGKQLPVPRDNVILELGMFIGTAGIERSFVLVPRGSNIHRPSDLDGLVVGEYFASPDADDREAAVASCVTKVASEVDQLGFRHTANFQDLEALIAQYDCCHLISHIVDNKDILVDKRVAEKQRIFGDMLSFCARHPPNKDVLVDRHTAGAYVALAAAIVERPERGDNAALRKAKLAMIDNGQTQSKILLAMKTLKDAELLDAREVEELGRWASRFRDPIPAFLSDLSSFRKAR